MKTSKFFIIIFLIFHKLTYSINNEELFLISIPKSGSHLLQKAIQLILKKNSIWINPDNITYPLIKNLPSNTTFISHLPFSNEKIEILNKNKFNKFIFIYRDPRDVIISRVFFELNRTISSTIKNQKQFDETVKHYLNNIANLYSQFTPWINQKDSCSIRFENIIGQQGGGSEILQYKEIKKLCNFLNIHSETKIKECINNLFAGTYTFREGKIGSWKKYFSNENKEQFKKIAGNVLISLGYEKDNNW